MGASIGLALGLYIGQARPHFNAPLGLAYNFNFP